VFSFVKISPSLFCFHSILETRNTCYLQFRCLYAEFSFPPVAQQPPVGQGLLIIEASWSHSDTPHSVGLLWMSDQPDEDTSTWRHTALTTATHPCARRDSKPQSQQSKGCGPTPLGSALCGEQSEILTKVYWSHHCRLLCWWEMLIMTGPPNKESLFCKFLQWSSWRVGIIIQCRWLVAK
jgi:hypothetical protein